jgi:hypothetical protein
MPAARKIFIALRDKKYVLLPNAQAICAIEHELGASIIAIARKLIAGELFIDEMALIVFHAMYAADSENTLPVQDIKNTIIDNGLTDTLSALSAMFSTVLGGVADATA